LGRFRRSTPYGGPVSQTTDDPADPAVLPLAHLGRARDDDPPDGERAPSGPVRHLRLIVIAAAAIVVAGFVVGVVLVKASAPPLGRGAPTAADAAGRYLHAVNAGDEAAAADIACDTFADQARAQARSGADPGITFALGALTMASKTDATIGLAERIRLPGGSVQRQQVSLYLARSGGRWLVCGRAV
jgi:hypothetical protein